MCIGLVDIPFAILTHTKLSFSYKTEEYTFSLLHPNQIPGQTLKFKNLKSMPQIMNSMSRMYQNVFVLHFYFFTFSLFSDVG